MLALSTSEFDSDISSSFNAGFRSDMSNPGSMTTDRKEAPPLPNGQNARLSSERAPSDGDTSDAGGFPEDEAVGPRGLQRNPMDRDIPKVTDKVGERIAQVFAEFLEK